MDLKDIRIDASKLDNADWVGDLPELNGVRVKVRAVENKDWRRRRQFLNNQVPRKRRVGGILEPEDQDRIMAILLCETSLVDWEGVEMDGKPVPFSKETALEFLTDPSLRVFFDAVLWAASVVAQQSREDAEDIAKN